MNKLLSVVIWQVDKISYCVLQNNFTYLINAINVQTDSIRTKVFT